MLENPSAPVRHAPLRLGVVIPAYNESANLGQLLEFLRSYPERSARRPIELEVWVDVSGSRDETPAIARAMTATFPGLHVIDTQSRDGLLLALDRLLALVQGDVILRMDADVQVTASTLDHLLETLERTGAGIVGGRIVPGETTSAWVRHLSPAEYELHHRVSMRSPKTTVVQLFRGPSVRLHPDSGVEDQDLQEQVVRVAGRACYDPEATVIIAPPANLRDFLFQRVRTIRHLRMHRRRGYRMGSTSSPRVVGGALLDALRARAVPRRDLVLFLAVEALARLGAGWSALAGGAALFQWEPLPDTKQPRWSVPSSAPGAVTTRPSEDPVPMLLR